MRKLLIGAMLLGLLGAGKPALAAPRHAMTQNEFRQVLHERDVAWARAWQQAEAAHAAAHIAAARRETASLQAHIAALERAEPAQQRAFAQGLKIGRAFIEAQSVLREPENRPGFGALQEKLGRELDAVQGSASPTARAFIRHAWAAHRFNQANP